MKAKKEEEEWKKGKNSRFLFCLHTALYLLPQTLFFIAEVLASYLYVEMIELLRKTGSIMLSDGYLHAASSFPSYYSHSLEIIGRYYSLVLWKFPSFYHARKSWMNITRYRFTIWLVKQQWAWTSISSFVDSSAYILRSWREGRGGRWGRKR